MKLPNNAHTSQPWRIHELTPDFRIEDVWQLPGSGGPDDFPRLVRRFVASDPSQGFVRCQPRAVRDSMEARRAASLGQSRRGDRLEGAHASRPVAPDLRNAPGPNFDALPFSPLYLTEDEFAAEVANRTMHGVMHIGRVADATGGGFRARMAVLVKPNGLLGEAYMVAIRPFRHLIVYPAMMRRIEREIGQR